MGIFIYVSIAKSVTEEEWSKVYEETLQFARIFSLAERKIVDIKGINVQCLALTEEWTETRCDWEYTGWRADGDYMTMRTAEEYCMPKMLVKEEDVDAEAPDAIFGALPAYLDYDWKDERFQRNYHLWGDKTQGEPYHMYLLAIACLMEARLGHKAFVYGDITGGQCRAAVSMINDYLDEPIDVPDRCDPDRLADRVRQLPLSWKERLAVWKGFYLGNATKEMGDAMRKYFPEEVCEEYWRDQFAGYHVDSYGFSMRIREYLTLGFDLEKLCSLVNYEDKYGKLRYGLFIKCIMDTKIYVKDKDCSDLLGIDQDDPRPYGVERLFAQLVFGRARNKKVNRYIPLEEVRKALENGLSEMCGNTVDISAEIDACLSEEEQEPSEMLRQVLETENEKIKDRAGHYDITCYDSLLYYEDGDTILPDIEESLKEAYKLYQELSEEDTCRELLTKPPRERCQWLVRQNHSILMRDRDWEKIFTDIEENETSFQRYYPMMRVRLSSNEIIDMVRAMAINDALYEYCSDIT